jgi:hypothetical protein
MSGDPVGDLQETIRIFVDEDRRHAVFGCPELADLLVQLPRVGAAGPARW